MLNFMIMFLHRIEIENDMLIFFPSYFIMFHAEKRISFFKPAQRILIPILYSFCSSGTVDLNAYIILILLQ